MIIKAFEAGKSDLIKMFLSRKMNRDMSGCVEKVIQSLLFGAINKYEKNKTLSQFVFKLLADKGFRYIVDKSRGDNLPLNDAILRKDSNLVADLLALCPNPSVSDRNGIPR